MQFIDKQRLYAKGGDGGDGCVSFRREKYVEFGGPDGGSGGNGGSVWLEADSNLSTLLDLAAHPHREATPGTGGKGSGKTGHGGEDLVVRVPCGTMVYKDARLVADLTTPGQRILAAKGGKGGRGNAAFKTASDNAPRVRERGEPGELAEIDLELKLLADVGLVGFPNAGKSTFLAAVSNARPKIADYPFTTLAPNLGVVRRHGSTFVLADIPGLIEGAHEGRGLGDEFLRHIERTKVILHLVDPFGFSGMDPAATIRVIEKELAGYAPELAKRPRLLVVTKMDLTGADKVFEKLKKRYRSRQVFAVSAASGKGVPPLLDALVRAISKLPAPMGSAEIIAEKKPALKLDIEDGVYVMRGEEPERLASMTDFELPRAVRRFQDALKRMGIGKRLARLGVGEGATVRIGATEFEWLPDSTGPERTLARRRKSYRTPRSIQE